MAERHPHPYSGPRQLAQSGRNLFLDRPEKSPHAQSHFLSGRSRTASPCLPVPLRTIGLAVQMDLHPPRSSRPTDQDRRQTAGRCSLTEYVTVIPNVSTKPRRILTTLRGLFRGGPVRRTRRVGFPYLDGSYVNRDLRVKSFR